MVGLVSPSKTCVAAMFFFINGHTYNIILPPVVNHGKMKLTNNMHLRPI